MAELVTLNIQDFRNEWLSLALVISFLYHWAISYFTDYDRIFRIIIEDIIIEVYCRDAKKLDNLYTWLRLRSLIIEGFESLNRETALLTDIFGAVRKLIRGTALTTPERERLLSLLEELESRFLREFHLMGVNESQIFVTSAMFYDAISYVLDTDGG